MACKVSESDNQTSVNTPQVSQISSSLPKSGIVNDQSKLTCVVQLLNQGDIGGDINIHSRCVQIISPEQIQFDLPTSKDLALKGHDLLVQKQCQASEVFYQKAYQQETSIAAKGYLSNRILNARQCQQGLISIEERADSDVVKSEEIVLENNFGFNHSALGALLDRGHQALKMGQCELASALYKQAFKQTNDLQEKAYINTQILNADYCLEILKPLEPRAQKEPKPQVNSLNPITALNPVSQASAPRSSAPPLPIFTPTPQATSFLVPSKLAIPTNVPATPLNLVSNNVQETQATLSWNAVTGADFYRLYRNGVLIVDHISGTTQTILSLAARTSYAFELAAVNANGESARRGLNLSTLGFIESGNSILYFRSGSLVVMRLDGSESAQLFRPERDAVISPDRTKVVQGDLKISDIFGDNTITVAHTLSDARDFAWSSDSSKIAFRAKTAANIYDLFIVNSDGSHLKQLTQYFDAVDTPAWSPNSQTLAFLSASEGLNKLYLVAADGLSTPTKIVNGSSASPIMWWPDGAKILFYANFADHVGMHLVNKNGSGLELFLNSLILDPQFSPQANQMAYSKNNDIFVINKNGTNEQNLTQNALSNRHPVWSQNGMQIYFDSKRTNNTDIYRIDTTGLNEARISTNSGIDEKPLLVP
jgi:hypothetical protein